MDENRVNEFAQKIEPRSAGERWLDCECDVCKQLDAIAHDARAWGELFEQIGHKCSVGPFFSYTREHDVKQLTIEGT
jgi:hypothetical protein